MTATLRFLGYFVQQRFAEALACRPAGAWPRSGLELWAAYRLGLYRTVAEADSRAAGWRAHFARAVSLAACGQRDAAAAAARKAGASPALTARRRTALASALAPFDIPLARSVLGDRRAPAALRAALLLAAGETAAARALVDAALARGAERREPELHLLRANAARTAGEAGESAPPRLFARLNAFLAAHDVPPVAPLDTDRPPGPCNLRAAAPPAPVDGPLISVLMPAYETAGRIGAALESLLAQSWRNLEILVVDDASGDDTGAVVQALAARDGRVRYRRLARNAGPYVARNLALAEARGDFVTCHDSDDWSHPLKLERQLRPLLSDARLVFTASSWLRLQDDGLVYARPVHPLLRLNPSSPLFRREPVLQRAGGWEPVRTGADSEFLNRLKLIFGRRALRRLHAPLALGAHRPGSLMTDPATGMPEGGLSPARLAYWEDWGHRHIAALREGRTLRVAEEVHGRAAVGQRSETGGARCGGPGGS